jgi:hypothetical protein
MDRTGSYLLLLKAKNFQDQGRQTNFEKFAITTKNNIYAIILVPCSYTP